MRKILILIILVLASCNSKDESKNLCDVTYLTLVKENNQLSTYLNENIKNKVEKHTQNKSIITYHSLTKNYMNYLSEIEIKISNNTTDILFDNDKYSLEGKEFINKTKVYKNEIEKLVTSENLRKRIDLLLNTNDVELNYDNDDGFERNEISENKSDKIFVYYLDYYFRGYSNNQSLAFLSNKKRGVLELENEFLGNTFND